MRITNTGRYKCTVNLNFEDTSEDVAGVFLVEPPVFQLEEGETKDIDISAFPKEEKLYRNKLIACVKKRTIKKLKCFYKNRLNRSMLCNQVRSLDHFVVQNSGDFLC